MEIVPAGPIDDLMRLVSQHDLDAIGGVTDGGVVGEVCHLVLATAHSILDALALRAIPRGPDARVTSHGS